MKTKLLFLIISILYSNYVVSQVRIGDFKFTTYGHSKLNEENLKKFKSQTTRFILPNSYSKSEYQKILSEIWDVTPFEINIDGEFDESQIKVGDAIAKFLNVGITKFKKSGMRVDSGFNIIDFHIVKKVRKKTKKGQLKWLSSKIGTIYFTPDIAIRQQLDGFANNIKGNLLNFKLGYLKNFLQQMNYSIKNNISTKLYDDFNTPELKNIKSKTLYIDKSFIYGYNPISINKKKAPETDDLMKDYLYDYKIVDYTEIENKILENESEDLYYLMYNQINSDKIITIINMKTGKIIYQDHKKMSFNLKAKDLKKISNMINKLNI